MPPSTGVASGVSDPVARYASARGVELAVSGLTGSALRVRAGEDSLTIAR